MKRNTEVSKDTRAARRKEGMEKIRRIYGEDTYSWQLPAMFAMETDPTKKGILLSVIDVLTCRERTAEECERLKKVAEEAEKECKMLMEKWGLT